jgi:hypothetical protein
MTIGAYELAFLELFQDRLASPAGDHRADFIDLLKLGQVIPLHYVDRENLSTVRARDAALDFGHPSARGGQL